MAKNNQLQKASENELVFDGAQVIVFNHGKESVIHPWLPPYDALRVVAKYNYHNGGDPEHYAEARDVEVACLARQGKKNKGRFS